MSDKPNYTLRQALVLPFLLYACWWAQPYEQYFDTQFLVWGLWGFTGLITVKLMLKLIWQLIKIIWNSWRRKVKNLHGSARWASRKDIKDSGMFDQ